MVMPLNKASSSSMSGQTNPNPRSSEISDPVRRSFTGNPFDKPSITSIPRSFHPNTPANSPSDHPRRSSIGRESIIRHNKDKENGKDQNSKPTNVRSPMGSKPTKNFMSPTISAASKIIPSPKKKILAERNESVRTSLSFTEEPVRISTSLPEINTHSPVIISEHKKETLTSKDLKTDPISDSNELMNSFVAEGHDCVNLDPTFNISPPPISFIEKPVRISTSLPELKTHSPVIKSEHNEETLTSSLTSKDLKTDPISDSNELMNSFVAEGHDCVNLDPTFNISPPPISFIEEPVRISTSLPELKTHSPVIKSEHNEETLTSSLTSKDLKTGPILDSKEPMNFFVAEGHNDCVNLEPTFNISPPPKDSDPSMPPYDPKTNYLSPRPQFLHYRPNPRVEHLISKKNEGKQLEESFIYSSFSDTDVTEETKSDDSQSELEEFSSGEMVRENVSEVSLEDTTFAEAKGESKRFFWRSKLTAFLLVLSVASLSIMVTNSLVVNHSVFNGSNLKIHVLSKTTVFAKENVYGLAQNFWVWSANFMSLLSGSISYIGGAQKLGPLQYCNLSVLIEGVKGHGYLESNQGYKETEGKYEIFEYLEGKISESTVENGTSIHQIYEESIDQESEASTEIDGFSELINSDFEKVFKVPEVKVVGSERLEEEGGGGGEEEESLEGKSISDQFDSQLESMISFDDEQVIVSEHDDVVQQESSEENKNLLNHFESKLKSIENLKEESIQQDFVEIELQRNKNVDLVGVDFKPATEDTRYEISESNASPNWIINELSQMSLMGIGIGIIVLLVLASVVAAASIFVYLKKAKISSCSSKAVTLLDQPLLAKKLDSSPIAPVSQPEEPCPSEISSIQKSRSSYSYKRLKSSIQAQSQDKRRESMASSFDSSMDSPSYGSFTTYEKIHSYHGNGEEEVITPVRRSSRIRKQVTSP